MGPRLPNVFIYLAALARPSRLRPDIRVKTIGHLNFDSLRREGFNAVVLDKDNCLTLPEKDELFPPFREAWAEARAAFPADRILVVSNSAGTKKDPAGIAAESVSHHLQVPVLIHAQPKPGCSREIVAYFRGELGRPTTRIQREQQHSERLQEEENKRVGARMTLYEEKRILDLRETSSVDNGADDVIRETFIRPTPIPRADPDTGGNLSAVTASIPADAPIPADESMSADANDIRLLVIGDRLFTDTLLAHRLRLLLPSSDVLSIHTTSLPQPKDVRILRWIEDRLSKGQTREPTTDYSRIIKSPTNAALETLNERPSVRDRYMVLRTDIRDSRLGWNPRSWTVGSLTIGIGRGLIWLTRGLARGLGNGARLSWVGITKLADVIRQRVSESGRKVAPSGEQAPARGLGTVEEHGVKSIVSNPIETSSSRRTLTTSTSPSPAL